MLKPWWRGLSAVMFALALVRLASCGPVGGNFPPPTPAPSDVQAWEALLPSKGGVWWSGPMVMVFRPDGTQETTADRLPGLVVPEPDPLASVGGVGVGRWAVEPLASGRFKIVLSNSQGTLNEFELDWWSKGAFDSVVFTSGGEVVMELRRGRPRR